MILDLCRTCRRLRPTDLSTDQTTRDSCTRQHELQLSTQRPFQQHPFSFYTQLGSTFGLKKNSCQVCHWKHFSLSQHVVGDLDLLHSQLRHLWLAGALPEPTPGWLKMPRPKIWGDGRGSAAGDMCVGHQGLPHEKKEHDIIWYHVLNRWNLGLFNVIDS